jgi:hypothetical protein
VPVLRIVVGTGSRLRAERRWQRTHQHLLDHAPIQRIAPGPGPIVWSAHGYHLLIAAGSHRPRTPTRVPIAMLWARATPASTSSTAIESLRQISPGMLEQRTLGLRPSQQGGIGMEM